jgi:hypothetical protein
MEPYCDVTWANDYFSTRLNAEYWYSSDIIAYTAPSMESIRLTDEDGNAKYLTIQTIDGISALGIDDAVPDAPTSSTNQYKALVTATEAIDRLGYSGYKTSVTQEREFPRNGDTTIADDIKKACAEEALSLLSGKDPEREQERVRVLMQQYATIKQEYDPDNLPLYILSGITSAKAWRYLLPYLRDIRGVRLDRAS